MGVRERRWPQGQVPPSCAMLLRVEDVKDRGMTVGLGCMVMVLAEGVSEDCVLWPQAGRGGELL